MTTATMQAPVSFEQYADEYGYNLSGCSDAELNAICDEAIRMQSHGNATRDTDMIGKAWSLLAAYDRECAVRD